ncbi:MAG: hypothetical protein AB3N19_17595 [Ruegeria sp.]
MMLRSLVLATLCAGILPSVTLGQSADTSSSGLLVELNAIQDVDGACRLTFLIQNQTGTSIDSAIFETVIFDAEGSLVSLSLFDFRDLPADRPRVRQFDLSGRQCASVGRALINGANTCTVDGSDNDLCNKALTLSSRVRMELLG